MNTNTNTNINMNLQTATELLDIDMERLSSFDSNMLKKQYHKMALLHHPDKCSDSVNATLRFQHIQSAYQYLLNFINNDNDPLHEETFSSFESNKEEINYFEVLSSFIKHASTSPSATGHLFTSIVKEILTSFNHLSTALFDAVDKEVALEIYSFLVKYQHIMHISEPTLDKVRDILFKKYEHTHLITINPSVKDIFTSNVYKLVYKGEIYYVPMWHEEVHYDCFHALPNELIIKCIPILPDNVSLDEQNNVLVVLTVDLKEIDLKSSTIPFSIDGYSFAIPCGSLFIKPVQRYTIKCAGIPRIDETDMYNDSIKSDIIVKILLINSRE